VDPFYVAAATAYDNLREAETAGFGILEMNCHIFLLWKPGNTLDPNKL